MEHTMKNKIRFKTKEEFILAVMAGRKFENLGNIHYYSDIYENPFRVGPALEEKTSGINGTWEYITSRDFTEIIEPRIEKRWRMLRDDIRTTVLTSFVNQSYIDENYPPENGWYKGDSITVSLKC